MTGICGTCRHTKIYEEHEGWGRHYCANPKSERCNYYVEYASDSCYEWEEKKEYEE